MNCPAYGVRLCPKEAPVLAGIAAASVQGFVAFGPRAGARVQRYGDPPEGVERLTPGPRHAQLGGSDLHAGIAARAGQRGRLERLCRYALRPPIPQDRLRLDRDGNVWLTLRHQWADGTTHLKFDPVESRLMTSGAIDHHHVDPASIPTFSGVFETFWSRSPLQCSFRDASGRGECVHPCPLLERQCWGSMKGTTS